MNAESQFQYIVFSCRRQRQEKAQGRVPKRNEAVMAIEGSRLIVLCFDNQGKCGNLGAGGTAQGIVEKRPAQAAPLEPSR